MKALPAMLNEHGFAGLFGRLTKARPVRFKVPEDGLTVVFTSQTGAPNISRAIEPGSGALGVVTEYMDSENP